MTAARRVVITGVGVVSPIGVGVEPFYTSLLEGRSGIRPIQAFDTSALPVHIAGEIPDFKARDFVQDKTARKSLRMMARPIHLAVAAAQLALDDGRVDTSRLDPTRFGVEFGSGLIASELPELMDAAHLSVNSPSRLVDLVKWGRQSIEAIQPLWMLKYLPNMLACHVSILHDAQGPNNSITESDVAGLLALGEAYHILLRDQADFFLVGAAESKMNPLSMVRQCLFEPLSRCQEPGNACRPFDLHRDGIVLGEGACVFCVEELEHARRRGARIYAEVVGFGAAFDVKRNGEGIARAIQAALKDAGIGPQALDHLNAQGLATRETDIWEARGIRQALGEVTPSVPVLAAKSYFGNLGAGAGTMELAVSVLGFAQGQIPGTLNHQETDPECPISVSPRNKSVLKPYALKLNFTPMGQCGALVIRQWTEV
jgi:3-oxoacyl-[acyl-carrier-protein] synthase II